MLVGEEVAPGADRARTPPRSAGSAPANMTVGPTGWSANSNLVTTPKLPPPPRSAQNRSGSRPRCACDDAPVGGHDLRADEVVDGQPVPRAQPADPAAQRQPADARVRDQAAGRREAVLLGRAIDVGPRRAALDDARGARPGRPERRASPRGRSSRRRRRPHGRRRCGRRPGPTTGSPCSPREPHGRDHVSRRPAADDDAGSAVDHRVPDGPRLVVARVAGHEHAAAD